MNSERAMNPGVGWQYVSPTQYATSTSLAFAVTRLPLLTLPSEPELCALPSSGDVLSAPLYSATYTSSDDVVPARLTVIVSAPPLMFFA